jgi:hypothetical protein
MEGWCIIEVRKRSSFLKKRSKKLLPIGPDTPESGGMAAPEWVWG